MMIRPRIFAMIAATILFAVNSAITSGITLAEVLAEPLASHPGRIYVAAFGGPDGKTTELGIWASSYVGGELGKVRSISLIPAAQMDKVLRDHLLAPGATAQHAGVAAWVGKQAGAVLVATGRVSFRENSLQIEVVLTDAKKLKVVGSATIQVPRTDGHSNLAERLALETTTDQAGHEGISFAACVYCPRPDFTEDAYQRKIEGIVLIRVLIGADGRTKQIRLLNSLHPDLDWQAIRALKEWRFRASQKNGKPVTAWNHIEVSFRRH